MRLLWLLSLPSTLAAIQLSYGEAVEHSFEVQLRAGYLLEDHYRYVSTNVSETTTHFTNLHLLNSYFARFDNASLLAAVRSDPGVEAIRENRRMVIKYPDRDESQSTTPVQKQKFKRWSTGKVPALNWWNAYLTAGKEVIPHVDDKGNLGIPGEFLVDGGKGVDVYVMDTGIASDTLLFKLSGSNFQEKSFSPYCKPGTSMEDTMGHGTHVAGIVANNADGVKVINVKVTCEGADRETFLRAFHDIIMEHNSKKASKPKGWRGSVINASWLIEDASDDGIESALALIYTSGIPMAAAAGNTPETARKLPCIHTSVICVASSNSDYKFSNFSTYGKSVDIIAPGEEIWSQSHLDYWDYVPLSGTSMAAPAVAGILANFVGYEVILSDTAKAKKRLMDNVVSNIIRDVPPGTVNKFANTGLNNPRKEANVPYLGAPGRDLAFEGDTNTAADGPVSTLTTSRPDFTRGPMPSQVFEGALLAITVS